MPSQQKLIKQGIKYTDSLFGEITKRLERGVLSSDTLEAFLVKYNEIFPEKGNPVISLGYDAKMLDLILKETNNHKFSRPAQKELVRVTIENQVGELIVDVGEDIRESVRDIVQEGYNNNLSQDEIAANISNRVSVIKNKRARAIARTEIARTATISDYVINKERGATHWYVECRNTACPVCKEAWHEHWSKANDESFKPSDESAGGRGWIGDKTYSMSDVGMLPPIHPNCRCVAYFVSENEIPKGNVIVEDIGTSTTSETTVNPRIAELEKQIADERALADKWRKRGNTDLAGTFENNAKRLEQELTQLKNPSVTTSDGDRIPNKDLIDNVLNQVLEDVGLNDKIIQSEPKIEKNIKTSHESNLWENLADKHGFELTHATNAHVKFYDKKNDTTIEFNIGKNKDWIDYTNSGKKVRNMEDFLESYNNAPPNYKKACPTIKIVGSAPYSGVCILGPDIFHIEIARSGYQELKLERGSGNLQHTMLHEMSHAYDMRYAPSKTHARMGDNWWFSKQKNGKYKKATTTDKRNRKKTGGQLWVSEYVQNRTSNPKKMTEDWADLGGVVAFRDIPDKSMAYLLEINDDGELVKVSYDELKRKYPNRWQVLEEAIFGEYLPNW